MKRFTQRVSWSRRDGLCGCLARVALSLIPYADVRPSFSQLARTKDPNKSGKNKKEKDGTASPNSLGTSRDANQSPVLTPTSSTSTLNDNRNKPLPSNNVAAGGDHGSSAGTQVQSLLGSAVGQGQGMPDRFLNMTSSPQGANGGGSPARHGGSLLPPTVIISPSGPVGSLIGYRPGDLLTCFPPIAHTPARCRRDHAPRPGSPKGRPEVAHVRSAPSDTQRRCARGREDASQATFVSL